MLTSLELRIVFVGLTLYGLGIVSANRRPAQSRKAFIAGAINVIVVVGAAFYLPKFFAYLQDIVGKTASTIVLWLYILLLSVGLFCVRYFGVEDEMRQWTPFG